MTFFKRVVHPKIFMHFLSFLLGILSSFLSILLWVAVVVSTFTLFVLPPRGGILVFLVTVIFRSIYTLGLGPTLLLLGAANVRQIHYQPFTLHLAHQYSASVN